MLTSAIIWDSSGTIKPSSLAAIYLQAYAAPDNTINAITSQGSFINHAKTRIWYPAKAGTL